MFRSTIIIGELTLEPGESYTYAEAVAARGPPHAPPPHQPPRHGPTPETCRSDIFVNSNVNFKLFQI
jgi:hypothetical protein